MPEPEDLLPEELIVRFERCVNYPRESLGLQMLVQALCRAADRYAVAPAEVVQRCADLSDRCPTDAHLLDAARLIREDRDRRTAAVPAWQRPPACIACDDTGWIVVEGKRGSGAKPCRCRSRAVA